MSDRHRAPRRRVMSVTNTTGYGQTWWFHRLDCGHVEKRKRRAPASSIGCSSCVEAERVFARTTVGLMRLPSEDVRGSDDVHVDMKAGRVAAEIASRLHISVDMVNVQVASSVSGSKITGVSVWVPGDIAELLVEK